MKKINYMQVKINCFTSAHGLICLDLVNLRWTIEIFVSDKRCLCCLKWSLYERATCPVLADKYVSFLCWAHSQMWHSTVVMATFSIINLSWQLWGNNNANLTISVTGQNFRLIINSLIKLTHSSIGLLLVSDTVHFPSRKK